MNTNVLICDDDQMVRSLASKILERSGYTCFEAANGRDAINRIIQAKPSIDIIILDIQLPDLPCEEIINHIKIAAPKIKVLICSGHSANPQVKQWLSEGLVHYLMKPFGVQSLSQAVQSCLATA